MWITYLNWFVAILAICLWICAFCYLERFRIYDWFDNKFGKDDPMPTAADIKKAQESNNK